MDVDRQEPPLDAVPSSSPRPMDAPHSFTPRSPPSPADTLFQQMLVAAAQQVVPPPPSPLSNVPRRMPKSTERQSRVPSCTHMTMVRLYGPFKCHMCGKVPNIGWVYSCQQDHVAQPARWSGDGMGLGEALVAVKDGNGFFEAQAKVAESLNMSKSVIGQMRRGEYTYDQVDILLGQRRHVLEVIRSGNISTRSSSSSTPTNYSTSAPRRPNTTSSTSTDNTIIASIGTTPSSALAATSEPPESAPPKDPSTTALSSPAANKKPPKKPLCTFQVCHACRPIFHDRLHMAFEPVMQNLVPALSAAEISKLPLHDPQVVKGLGLRERVRVTAVPALEEGPGVGGSGDGAGGGGEYDFFAEHQTGWEGEQEDSSVSESSSCGSSVLDDEGDDEAGGVHVPIVVVVEGETKKD